MAVLLLPASAISRTLIVSCAIAAIAGVFLLGLPGAVLYQAFSGFEQGAGFQAVKADAAWPIALIVSILWPWGIPLAYVVARRLGSQMKIACAVLVVEFAWLSTICFLLSVVPE
jgi:hypothetical protein